MKKQEEKSEIDFVITWVDGNDPDGKDSGIWQHRQLNRYRKQTTEKNDTGIGIICNTGSEEWNSLHPG